MRFNSIAVVPVRSLEVGDLIAHEFLGGVVAGRITGIAYLVCDLTEEQRMYLLEQKVTIPEGIYQPIGGWNSCLIFADFNCSSSRVEAANTSSGHGFLNYDVNVAVFPTKENSTGRV